MPTPKDEFDDAFFQFVGDIVEERDALVRALTYIKQNLGSVCNSFEVCDHRSCRDSCTAWLLADAVLSGDYRLPGEQEDGPPQG